MLYTIIQNVFREVWMFSTAQKLLFYILFLACFAGCASAAPLPMDLERVTFADGGTASGSFVYDAATNTYSSVNVTTTAGTIRSGSTYNFVSNGVTPSSAAVLVATVVASSNATGTPAFFMGFGTALTGTGGSVLIGGQEANCSNATCTGPTGPTRFTATGSVIGGAVPTTVPTLSSWMFGLLALLLAGAGAMLLGRTTVEVRQ